MASFARGAAFIFAVPLIAIACGGGTTAVPNASGEAAVDEDASVAAIDSGGALPIQSGAPDASLAVVDAGHDCSFAAECAASALIGTVSGDTGAGRVTAQGTRSTWVHVRVTEDDVGVASVPLELKVTLTSPPGENYDLYVYLAANNATTSLECSTVRAQSTSTTMEDELAVSWPDNRTAGRDAGPGTIDDDSKNATVEIRYVGGPCSGGAWSLVVEGHTST